MSFATNTTMPTLEGVTHREVHATGIRFHVAEAGSGEPVFALHGWPQHWWAWRKVLPLLAADRRVICPDLRGFGWSEAPPGDYQKRTLAEDMIAVLDALELDRVDLIAHDWGAWIGYQLCLRHPERVAHYLALNIVTPWPEPPTLGAALGLWRLLYQVVISTPVLGERLIRRPGSVKRLITSGAVHPNAWTEQDLESFEAVLREPARARASVELYRTFLLHELVPYLSGVDDAKRNSVPTLQLHGTRDIAIDYKRLGRWQEHSDDMALELRHDSGHFIAEELPELVAARALALFAGQSPHAVLAADS
jgi:pimeloyl-ACP methyl ester carboxylesterase